jgi:hypothetical protein
MAIMIKVQKRGTDAKNEIRAGIKFATRKLRFALFCSLVINIVLGYVIYAGTF